MTDSASQTFVRQMVADLPDLRPLFDQHLADNSGEVLANIFMFEVSGWVLAGYRAGADTRWQRVLTYLDDGFRSEGSEVEEMIGVSFVESLPFPQEPGGDIAERLPPALAGELRLQRPWLFAE